MSRLRKRRHGKTRATAASALWDLQLAPDVEAGALLDHERGHCAAALGLDLGEAVAIAGLGRVPDRDPDDFVPVGRVALVRTQHPLRELTRPPRAAELVARTRLQPAGRYPDVALVELHGPASSADRCGSQAASTT